MKIFVTAKPSARENTVERHDDIHCTVSVHEPPIQGKANRAVIKMLAEYLNISQSSITILRGTTCKEKIVEIP